MKPKAAPLPPSHHRGPDELRGLLVRALRGSSPAMQCARELVLRIAASPASTVLITGESGTGKDVVAHLLHELSSRRLSPFVNITCSALPDALLESELFGHERGAFTDARQDKRGLLELANGGTVFLDEIGEMPQTLQAKLLRFLEERAFRRVGGLVDTRTDVRVIAATHRDLPQRVRAGIFREDLYYRLAVLQVHLPSLRERAGDVVELARHLTDQFAAHYARASPRLSDAALSLLSAHAWPGNVRELRNVLERAVLLSDGRELGPDDLALTRCASETPLMHLPSQGLSLARLERELVAQALDRAHGNRTRAAALLGLSRDQLRHRVEKFGLAAPPSRAAP